MISKQYRELCGEYHTGPNTAMFAIAANGKIKHGKRPEHRAKPHNYRAQLDNSEWAAMLWRKLNREVGKACHEIRSQLANLPTNSYSNALRRDLASFKKFRSGIKKQLIKYNTILESKQ